MSRGKEIKKISDLFEIYKKRLIAPEGSVITALISIVEDLIGFKLDKNKIKYSVTSRTLFITAPGPVKTEVRLREKEILNHLRGRLGEKRSPTSIK